MTKLCDIRNRYKLGLGEIGVEIETESESEYTYPKMKYWGLHPDGSLRHFGIEYVLNPPLDYGSEAWRLALVEFDQWSKKRTFEESIYTSVHVHLNFVERELVHLANFITLYVLLENVLGRYCGPNRDGNLFCLSTSKAEQNMFIYRDLITVIAGGNRKAIDNHIGYLSENNSKYSGLNVVPLKTLGSVEVRTHAGTTDVNLIDRWVGILHSIYRKAQQYENPEEIFEQLHVKRSYLGFVKSILGSYYDYFDEKTIDYDVDSTLFYAKTLLYPVKDWSKFGVLKILNEPKFRTEHLMSKTIDEVAGTDWHNNYGSVIATYALSEDF